MKLNGSIINGVCYYDDGSCCDFVDSDFSDEAKYLVLESLKPIQKYNMIDAVVRQYQQTVDSHQNMIKTLLDTISSLEKHIKECSLSQMCDKIDKLQQEIRDHEDYWH